MRQWMTLKKRKKSGETLDRAVRAWHRSEATEEALSDDSREAIFHEFRKLHASGEQPQPHATLFLPAARWAWGAAVPIAVLSLVVGSVLLTQGPFDQQSLVAHQPRVDVTKSGDEVVFVIQNGDREHTISKLTDPDAADGEESFTTTTGRFRDRLDSEAEIVYYRID